MNGGARWFGITALAVTPAVTPAPSQAPPVFHASVEAVYVDVFVSRDGQPIPGLQASDFEVKDNGVRQAAELVAAESRPLRAVLVFDTSSSLIGERLPALKAAGGAFLNGLRPGDEAALMGFSEEITWLAPRPSTGPRCGTRSLGSSPRARPPPSTRCMPRSRSRKSGVDRSSSCSRTVRTT